MVWNYYRVMTQKIFMQQIEMDKSEFMGVNEIKKLRIVEVNRKLSEYNEIKI